MGAYGLFLVSGLAVGALYALGRIGLVLLNRATGVLNFTHIALKIAHNANVMSRGAGLLRRAAAADR